MTLKERVKDALSSINDGYNQARNDLAGTVAEVAEVISSLTNGRGKLLLEPVTDDADGTIFGLTLEDATQGRKKSRTWIQDFRISPRGYPISIGDQDRRSGEMEILGELSSKDEVETYLEALATGEDSTLTASAAMIMRRTSDEFGETPDATPGTGSGTSEGGDDIPF